MQVSTALIKEACNLKVHALLAMPLTLCYRPKLYGHPGK